MQNKVISNPKHLIDAAWNRRPERMPIYEHIINVPFMQRVYPKVDYSHPKSGDHSGLVNFFGRYIEFFLEMGYDCVSYESSARSAFPGGGALGSHIDPAIKNRADFDRYPWQDLPGIYLEKATPMFAAMREALPTGMLLIGGVGNGVFECVQDLTGYENLCLLRYDDPELYHALFKRVREYLAAVWQLTLERWGDMLGICRMGDDLGFRTQTLIPADDIREHVVPGYKLVADLAHAHGKPFLLHSCGCIFDVMDDIIEVAGINAKHSNEDQIAPFTRWTESYNGRIALFGGIDLNVLYLGSEADVRRAVRELCKLSQTINGFALGTGNSIPTDVPIANYLAMVEEANSFRLSQEG